MPTIAITPDQAAALARGENITIEAPEPPQPDVKWNLSYIPAGRDRQRYHGDVMSPGILTRSGAGDVARKAAQKWISKPNVAREVARLGGGIVAVCRRAVTTGNAPYHLRTGDTRYYRVDASGVVQETI